MTDDAHVLINQLRTTLGKMETAFSTIAEAIVWTDADTRIEWCNTSFDRLIGREHLEVLGARLSDILPLEQQGERLPPEAHPVSVTLNTRRPVGAVYEFQRAGKRAFLHVSAAHVSFEENEVSAVLIIRDVTEQKENEASLTLLNETLRRARVDLEKTVLDRTAELSRTNEDLRKEIVERKRVEKERESLLHREQKAREEAETVSRLKDEFLATLSHELRTPLTPILGWVKMLGTQQLDQATQALAIQAIERNVKSEAKIIDDLLDVSRIVSGKLPLDIKTVELAPVIEAAIDTLTPAANAKHIRILKFFDNRIGLAVCDPNRMQQIVWNLLSNAIKFTPNQGRVEIILDRIDSNARIRVTDTGQGVDPEFLPHVFERFRQADSSIKRNHGGLGLGLAIVRHLVELHGGTVGVASGGPGKGTTFTVEFPLEGIGAQPKPVTDQPAAASTSSVSLSGVRIVIVEDEPDTCEFLNTVLSGCGADVVVCGTALEALDYIERHAPDIILADIGMPDMDGYELIHKVRESTKASMPAVALTAHATAEDRDRALAAGFQSHVPKPFEPERLIREISRLYQPQVTNPQDLLP